MEKTKILTNLDFKTLKYCNLFLMKYQKKTKIWFAFTAILALGVAIYDLVVIQQWIFAAFSVLFVFYSGYQIKTIEKKLDTQLTRFFTNRPVVTQTVEVDDEKLTVIRSVEPDKPIVYDWSFVTEVCEMPQYYMLRVGKGSPIIIDRNPESVLEGSKQNLDSIIAEKASMKPYKKTDEDIVKIPVTFVHKEIPSEDVVEVENVVEDVNEVEEPVVTEEDTTLKDNKKEE